jgi:hypothetical protein
MVEKGANNLLDEGDCFCVKRRGNVGVVSILHYGAVDGLTGAAGKERGVGNGEALRRCIQAWTN